MGACKFPRTYYGRTLITRVGKLELRVPQDRAGRFSTELFERYQRSERALVAALAEMYVQGVSDPQKPALAKAGVKAIAEELCGHSFSASSISAMNQRLDDVSGAIRRPGFNAPGSSSRGIGSSSKLSTGEGWIRTLGSARRSPVSHSIEPGAYTVWVDCETLTGGSPVRGFDSPVEGNGFEPFSSAMLRHR